MPRQRSKSPVRGWVVMCLCLSIVSCTRSQDWRLKDVSGLVPPLQFALTDDGGRAVSANDYRGRVVLLFLGYTHCPDACPTTLATLAAAIHAAGAAQQRYRVLFLTVDPRRDTVERMHRYVNAFGPEFIGLRGNDRQLEDLARRYRIAFSAGTPDSRGEYEVTHSSAVFVFDAEGQARLMILPRDTPDAIAQDLRRLVSVH